MCAVVFVCVHVELAPLLFARPQHRQQTARSAHTKSKQPAEKIKNDANKGGHPRTSEKQIVKKTQLNVEIVYNMNQKYLF